MTKTLMPQNTELIASEMTDDIFVFINRAKQQLFKNRCSRVGGDSFRGDSRANALPRTNALPRDNSESALP